MSLAVSDLTCRRSGRLILKDLAFGCAAGEALLLKGPNGVGKSTCLRAVAGLVPSSGDIRCNGVSLGDDRDAYHQHIAYAGHLDAIKPQLSLRENLAFWSDLFGGDGADAALELFDLADLADRPAQTCSAGQKRRLGLARLAVARRNLWLLDEPTVSLDARTVERFTGVLKAHLEGGGMAVIATHLDLAIPATDFALTPVQDISDDPFLAGAF